MAHALRYYKNIILEDGRRIRIEFHEKDGTAPAMELGDVIQALNLEIQGGDDIDAPIVKTQLNFTLVDAPDHQDHKTKKCGAWEEFYSPDATHWRVLLFYRNSGESSYTQFWGGYITPDSFHESLSYRAGVSFIARDNIGHLQDFPFDAQGNADGMISLYDLLTAAWAKIESPMELVAKTDGDAEWLRCEGNNALYTYMNVSAFAEKNWLDAVTEVLYGYGLVMRYVGENMVYVYPLRNLAIFPYPGSGVDVRFEAGAERELSPAARRIEETAEYDLVENLPQPLVDNTKDFTGSVEKIDFTKYNSQWTIDYWKINRSQKGQGWINNSSLPSYFNPLGYAYDDSVDQADLSYMWFACAPEYYDVAEDGRAIEFSKYLDGGNPISMGISFGIEHLLNNNTLSRFRTNYPRKIRCYISAVQNGITKYLTTEGTWSTSKSSVDVVSADGNFALTIPADEYDGTILLSIKIVKILQSSTIAVIYAPIYSFTLSVANTPLLKTNSVNTNYNAQNNVILTRSPKIAPAMNKTFMQGVIKNGIFIKQGTRYNPASLWSWRANGDGAQQMAVYNHLQLLCYHGKPNNILTGNIVNADVTNHAKVYRWNGTEHLLLSGSLNLINGFIENATLREFTRYENMWGDLTDTADFPEVDGGATTTAEGGASSSQAATYSNTTEVNIGGGGTIILDTFMSDSSTNGVQNKVIKTYVDSVNDTLTTSINKRALQSDFQALEQQVSKINIPTKLSQLQNDANYAQIKPDGVMEIGQYLDFHRTSDPPEWDNSVRLHCDAGSSKDGIVVKLPKKAGRLAIAEDYAAMLSWYNSLKDLLVAENGNVRIKTNAIIDGDVSSS